MKRHKCLVEGCGHVTRSRSGICNHIVKHHPGSKMIKGETFNATKDAVTNPRRNGPRKVKRVIKLTPKKPAAKTHLITPETKFIDIPCVIRVNVSGIKVQDIRLVAAC